MGDAHSSEHLPTLIKEASPCSLWQLKQKPSTVMQRIRVCKVLNPRWDILTPTLPLRLRNFHGRRGIKTVRGRGHIVCVERKQTVAGSKHQVVVPQGLPTDLLPPRKLYFLRMQ